MGKKLCSYMLEYIWPYTLLLVRTLIIIIYCFKLLLYATNMYTNEWFWNPDTNNTNNTQLLNLNINELNEYGKELLLKNCLIVYI